MVCSRTVVDQHPEGVDVPSGGRRNERRAVLGVARLHVRSVRDQALQTPRRDPPDTGG